MNIQSTVTMNLQSTVNGYNEFTKYGYNETLTITFDALITALTLHWWLPLSDILFSS